MSKRRTLRKGRVISVAAVAALVVGHGMGGNVAFALPDASADDPSAAEAQILGLDTSLLGDLNVAALGHTFTSNPGAPGPESGTLDLALLDGAIDLDLGTLNLPLLSDGTNSGLLDLGDLGAAASYSGSPSLTESTAASGVLGDNGAIDVGAIDASTDPAYLELTDLLGQLGVDGLTDQIIDQASIEIGALAARASESAGTVDDSYRIADLNLSLHSELVAGLSDTLATTIQGTTTAVDDLVGEDGALTDLLGLVDSTLGALSLSIGEWDVVGVNTSNSTVSIAGLDTLGTTVTTELLQSAVENETGSVLVDLSTGTISVDLAKILVETGAGADLNSLPANTSVLTSDTINAIVEGVTEALTGDHPEGLLGKTRTILETTLNSLEVTISVDVALVADLIVDLELATGAVTVQGSLAQFAGTATPLPTVDTDLDLLGLEVGDILNPVISVVTNAVASTAGPLVDTALNTVIGALQPALTSITGPIVTSLDPILDGVLAEIVDITINEQPTAEPTNGEGDLGEGSFTERDPASGTRRGQARPRFGDCEGC